jgi:ABC-type multidrug transport system ATPase subunit
MEDIIKTRELSRAFGRRQVVRNLTLSVPEGNIFALIGPNGAGKTTSLEHSRTQLRRSDSAGYSFHKAGACPVPADGLRF